MKRVAMAVFGAVLCGCGVGAGPRESAPTPTPPAPTPSPSPTPTPIGTTPPPAACSGFAAQPTDSDWNLTFGGLQRVFHVHVPPSYTPSVLTPLVLDFHGYSGDAAQEEILSQMNPHADAEGFLSVHAEGTGVPQSWNAGACCGEAASSDVDDVGFVGAMLDALEAKLCIDPKRVFATGMSNGGFLSQRLGCELSDRIAAIAPVAGVLGVSTCQPGRPVPIIEFHGTADPLVPYLGNPLIGYPSVPATFSGWAARDGCTGSPTQTYDVMDSSCATYEQCSAGAEVTLCTVQSGGHTWPGGTPVPALGYTTPWLSATDTMWSFFVKHPLP